MVVWYTIGNIFCRVENLDRIVFAIKAGIITSRRDHFHLRRSSEWIPRGRNLFIKSKPAIKPPI